ncbi:biliverdin-producing heme oxygenase [Pseudoalteromonas prydzensis]|uniref:Biliverdin-producing heme oxygenase n=1 Tax=Pseudoalteromonas prydzensis TaxID=182141 RepID=A0ABR9FR76_9GAMM|nr:biliverdin-producing heme oxygenase [Pseudoalteromonas prydzensis]MBE0459339.1 biliverdin-producing heme oxygenase [Pseudoalteromonas prydzensis]
MSLLDIETIKESTLTAQFKTETTTIHDGLDKAIMTKRPFSSIERYALFLQIQLAFHIAVAPLYHDKKFQDCIAGLASMQRLDAVYDDLCDLSFKQQADDILKQHSDTRTFSFEQGLAWLYVVEGSNLGAEYLLKAAKRINLSETFGARHLAPAEQGRSVAWQQFSNSINKIELDELQIKNALIAAQQAFSFVRELVDKTFAQM